MLLNPLLKESTSMKTPPIIQVRVIISEHIPGAAFSLNNVPNNIPKPINIIAEGIIIKRHNKTLVIVYISLF